MHDVAVKWATGIDLSGTDRTKILSGNARALLRL
jgi:hypothetical protein